ncbi:AMP-dependent synthetase/ligase [Streptomyces sp. HUAS TT20]|uniref:AMP-dependent synthetase/ligase n=1 Tax=Streptomyces sp. HUAS TT20 TaxID=3447509 RepID=UPI0021D9FC84|nr:long-chain fatty acid--CoA ligase [Streptomyces sp. HUAS 15-9]UXY25207.1 long-chain fatty acid--CoA ligase [Streptomyces sp. HUAS 15-9]
MRSVPAPIEQRPPSVAHLFLSRVKATPDREAYRYPAPADDLDGEPGAEQWRSLTWTQTAQRVKAVAAGLVTLDIRAADRVGIASETRMEWIIADLGTMCAGAATTTVYPSTNADETAYILADSGSRALFAENERQLTKIIATKDQLPRLKHVILFDAPAGPVSAEGLNILTLAELEHHGTTHLKGHPDAVDNAVGTIDGRQLATLIYTSGTTGRPKGVFLTHDGLAYQGVAQAGSELIHADDVQFLWLPLAHVFGKALISGQIHTGHVLAVDGRVDRIGHNLQVIRPTAMAAVPRIFEKVYNGIAAKARADGTVKHRVFRWAASVARAYARTTEAARIATGKESAPWSLKLQHTLADKLVYAKIRAAFGGRLRHAISGSAPLAPELGYFFAGVGVRILEGYGMTETSGGVIVNRAHDLRTGTVGVALPGFEVRIDQDGEILLRGPGVMRGYHNLPDASAEALTDDGWLRTGDIGEVDTDGFLRITDRKKDTFKTSNGKYVAPSEVEGKFRAACPFASNILLIGSSRNYCTALIALDEAAIMSWAAEHGIGDRTYAEVVATEEVRQLIETYVQRVNNDLQRWQTIKEFTLLPRDLDVEHGELTPSLKIKRPVVERTYAELITAMYAGTQEA